MFATLLTSLAGWQYILFNPLFLAISVFQLWMFIDALRKQEWFWAVIIFFGSGLGALLYYLNVYRSAPSATSGFELPGAHNRKRIKELQAQIYHLDKAHHHSQLADIYFQQGRLTQAEAGYRAALERDPEDLDTRAHLGQCLLRQKRAGTTTATPSWRSPKPSPPSAKPTAPSKSGSKSSPAIPIPAPKSSSPNSTSPANNPPSPAPS